MKKLVLAFVSLAAFGMTEARADYAGFLSSASPYTVEVQTTTSVAMTYLRVTTRGTLVVDLIETFDPTTGVVTRTIPNKTARLILLADAPTNGSAVLKIAQGTSRFEIILDPSRTIQIDVGP